MFNNAGFGGVSGELDTLELGERYRYTVDVLFTGVLAGIKHASRAMKANGTGGSIINTASVAGLRGGWGPHVYTAMKAAVINVTRSTALELGPSKIRVNAICPGFIATAIFAGQANMNWEQRQQFISLLEQTQAVATPIQRPGTGNDIASMALFLASDESTFDRRAGLRRRRWPDGRG
ncbi:MAG: SDR family oxidoreductase [Gammaproteobacteria bacterium]|nr:SDR family oxidoreductase [Gammaproteobacteria bacterium]